MFWRTKSLFYNLLLRIDLSPTDDDLTRLHAGVFWNRLKAVRAGRRKTTVVENTRQWRCQGGTRGRRMTLSLRSRNFGVQLIFIVID